MAILVRTNRSDYSSNHITILNRSFNRLENNGNNPFSSCIPVGPFIKAIANAIRREKALVSQNLEDARVKKKVCAGHHSL